jgi:Fe2+ or Zn2+ uptake regulation protein
MSMDIPYKKEIIRILQAHEDCTAEEILRIMHSRGSSAIELRQVARLLDELTDPIHEHEIHKKTVYFIA